MADKFNNLLLNLETGLFIFFGLVACAIVYPIGWILYGITKNHKYIEFYTSDDYYE